MESVAEVPEEASGLRQPRFWIRVFLLLDRLPAKANKPCLPCRHTHTHTHTTILWFSGFCPGPSGWAGNRRNIRPLTPISDPCRQVNSYHAAVRCRLLLGKRSDFFILSATYFHTVS